MSGSIGGGAQGPGHSLPLGGPSLFFSGATEFRHANHNLSYYLRASVICQATTTCHVPVLSWGLTVRQPAPMAPWIFASPIQDSQGLQAGAQHLTCLTLQIPNERNPIPSQASQSLHSLLSSCWLCLLIPFSILLLSQPVLSCSAVPSPH